MIKEPLPSGISQMQQCKGLSCPSSEVKEGRGRNLRAIHVASLQDLISKLYFEFEKDRVDVDYICRIMTAYKSQPHEWEKYAKFDSHRYTRNLVDSGNGKFNLMILCWGEGHGSAIHDHADAHCFMKVLQGTLCEIRFAFPNESEKNSDVATQRLKETGRTNLGTNEVCYINDSLGLHRVENPSYVKPAVSLHLYCPPFDTCSVFNQKTGKRTKCTVTFWSKFGEGRSRTTPEREPKENIIQTSEVKMVLDIPSSCGSAVYSLEEAKIRKASVQ